MWNLMVGAIFVLAAALKSWDLEETLRVLAYLGVPQALTGFAVYALIGTEAALGLLLILPRSPHWASWSAAGLLFAFTCVLAYLALDAKAPSCGCLGSLNRAGASEAQFGLFRNGLLLLIGGTCALWD
jgi:hypothetical protein